MGSIGVDYIPTSSIENLSRPNLQAEYIPLAQNNLRSNVQ
jgi:hypothetical protein